MRPLYPNKVADNRAAELFREKVGRELRRQYMDLVTQPVPDRWLDLLTASDDDAYGCVSDGASHKPKPK